MQRIWNKRKRLIIILILIAAIPTTVFLAQKQQEIRQHADENKAAIGVSPSSLPRGGTVTFEWRYNGMTPESNDYLEIVNNAGHVGSIFMSGCGDKPGATTPSEGSCTFNTSPIGPDSYVVKIIRNGAELSRVAFRVTYGQAVGPIPEQNGYAADQPNGSGTSNVPPSTAESGEPVACGPNEQKSEEYSCRDGWRCYNDYQRSPNTACEWKAVTHETTGLWYHCDKDDSCPSS